MNQSKKQNIAFDIAHEVARLVDAGKAGEELVAEIRRKFPRMTVADIQRAKLIGIERVEILEEERTRIARDLAKKWFSGADKSVIDTSIQLMLREPSAETLFPKPDKSKS
jgi:hypothetical protein